MKKIILLFAFLLVHSFFCQAQSIPCSEPGWSEITRVEMETVIPSSTGRTAKAIWEFVIARTASNQINAIIDVSSIRFEGDPDVVDFASTKDLFDAISFASASKAVELGLIDCPASCASPGYVTVLHPSCVDRFGTGESTRFIPCSSSNCCTRRYGVCCPNGAGSPDITFVDVYGAGCQDDDCSTTCQ